MTVTVIILVIYIGNDAVPCQIKLLHHRLSIHLILFPFVIAGLNHMEIHLCTE